jgi:hypothetical protein
MHAAELHYDEEVETIALDQPLERDWQALNQAMLPTCHVRLQTVELQAVPAGQNEPRLSSSLLLVAS